MKVLTKSLWFLALITAATSPASAQTPLNTNLLVNPSFEGGLTGWTSTSPSADSVSYGTPNYPTSALSQVIGGGGMMLRNTAGDALIEQVIPLVSIPGNSHLFVGGYFGGGGVDRSRLVIRYLDGGGAEILRENLDWVSAQQRNTETILMLRQRRLPIPPGASSVVAQVELDEICCSGIYTAADAIFVELQTGPITPAPLPLQTDLMTNGSFESGWAPGSPITPNTLSGWQGAGQSPTLVTPYSDLATETPDTIVSCLIGGGVPGFHCVPGGSGNLATNLGDSALRQVLDLRGNTASFGVFGAFALEVSGFLGGANSAPDTSSIQVRFLDESMGVITALPVLGPVTEAYRNQETVILPLSAQYFIPPNTAYAEIQLILDDICCSGFSAYADVIKAQLVTPTPPAPVNFGANLISNGSFENGSLPESPLELTNPDGWQGIFAERANVLPYGSSPNLPGLAFASTFGLGGTVLHDATADSGLRQMIDVSGSQSLINQGLVEAYAQAWLGGNLSDLDNARLEITCLNPAGVQVGGAGGLTILGPVTAQDRANQTTLLKRDSAFSIPPGTTMIQVELLFEEFCCGGSNATADDIRLVLTTTNTGNPVLWPGSGEDLRLFTGVNSLPSTGPGNEIKPAIPGDTLWLKVTSPQGSFDFGALILAATPFSTGSGPFPMSFPGIWLDPNNFVILKNGLFCAGFGCDLVLPTGTESNYLIPFGASMFTIRVQAFAFPLPGSGITPANGAFALTEAHDIVIQ